MVKDNGRVEPMTTKLGFKVKMFGCRASRAACQANYLTRFYLLPHLYKVSALMTI